MGDSERWWLEARGLSREGSESFGGARDLFQAKGKEWWGEVELWAAELITAIQANPESEDRRKAVIDYVTNLIKSSINCEVVKFGSVPLKTYLPDGDIDLTLISPNPEVKRKWFDDVFHALQKESANPNAKFWVTDVQGVRDAEVKLIKIYVAKLLVDISFDQLGGVCTLCFLEEVDRLIGDDHLFKRSIILVKAWCYYESRLLGAANSLMSTYALETLVLYIFHLFHASLRGPLQVLYLFLEFFSGFDWDQYCVSLSGLATFSKKTERPSHVGEGFQKLVLTPWREDGELLFTKVFLDACERAYGGLMPIKQIAKSHKFAVKSLNIMDPLHSTNNLGRSVNRGNCARIRRAFVLGAKTMRSILNASEADVSNELNQFFKNCIFRSTQRLEVGVSSPRSLQPKVPNGVLKIGGAKRDTTQTERNEDSSHSSTLPVESAYPDLKAPTVQAESASGREMNAIQSAGKLKSCSVTRAALNSRDTKNAVNKDSGSIGLISHSPHIDEERMRIPSQICSLKTVCDQLPGTYVGDELPPGMVNGRNGSARGKLERRDFLLSDMESAEVLQQVAMANGNHGTQHRTNGSASSCSRNGSEDEGECVFQSSSKESFETTRNGSLSVLHDHPVDQHSTSAVVGEHQVNEEKREFSAPLEEYKQAGNGCEHAEASSSKGRGRKGRIHQQNGCQSKDLEGSGTGHGKPKRGSGKPKGAWHVEDGKEKIHGRAGFIVQDGGVSQVSSSTTGGYSGHLQQSPVPAPGYQHVRPPCHSSSDATTGAHFKISQSRPYPNAAGPGSFRHSVASRHQFDPGTARMTGGVSGPSHSSPAHHYAPSYCVPPLGHVMYSPCINILKSGNANNRTGQDANGSVEVPVDNSGDSPSYRSRSKPSEQITVGIVETLEAGGVIASTSSRRSQTVAARSTHSGSSSEFLTGDLKLHLGSLAFAPFCEYVCSPSLNQILYPAYASETHAHNYGSWEGPGRPDAAFPQLLPPQFYAFPQFHPFPQAGFFPYYRFPWGRGVELSPRPRGTGTYLPNTQLRQNIRAPVRGQNRGMGQNASSEDKYHQLREHGPNQRTPPNKDDPQAQASSNRLVETRTDGIRGLHHPPKHHASHSSHSSEPVVSGLRAEEPQPSEVIATIPLDVRTPSIDTPEQDITVMPSGSPESNGSPDLGDEHLASEYTPPDLCGGLRSTSIGHSCDALKSDTISNSPTSAGEVMPTSTSQRTGRPTYYMKEEDFPPLGGQQVNHGKMMAGGTSSIANVIAGYVSS